MDRPVALTGLWQSIGSVSYMYTDDGWTSLQVNSDGSWFIYMPRSAPLIASGTGGREACEAWLKSDEGRKWYRLPDEVPARGAARDLARAADFPTLMRALADALNPGPSEAHVMRRQAHAAGTVPPDPECICGAPCPRAKVAPRRCETCGSPDVLPVGQAKCTKCIDGKARDYDAQSRAMLLASIDQYAALLRDLAESQRANREAAEVLRAVGTERALEAAEKCEACGEMSDRTAETKGEG